MDSVEMFRSNVSIFTSKINTKKKAKKNKKILNVYTTRLHNQQQNNPNYI